MATIKDFSGYEPTWCPGCGNWAIGIALKSALVQLGLDPSTVTIVFGIGCSGNMNDFINAYGFHSLHGRAIPCAVGIKIANHRQKVIVVAGDGDCLGEGGNHLIHTARGNHDITVILHDNRVYGLTTGQASPTSMKGYKSKSTPFGIIEAPLNPLSLALTSGTTFVASAFAGNLAQMTQIIKQGIDHRGFALVNVLQPCVSFNKINNHQYYLQHSYNLDEKNTKNDFKKAVELSLQVNEEKFPLGVIYQVQQPTYTDQLPQLKDKVLIDRKRFIDFKTLYSSFE